jgi:hypothetical protein
MNAFSDFENTVSKLAKGVSLKKKTLKKETA